MGLTNFILTCEKDNEELKRDINYYKNKASRLEKENQELKKHLEVPETCNLKTLEDYKSYYEDATKEQILEDTYIEYCAYVNLAHRYSELEKQLENKDDFINKLQASKDKLNKWNYEDTMKQKEFIKYLEDEIQTIGNKIFNLPVASNERNYLVNIGNKLIEILQKYKEIIGGE